MGKIVTLSSGDPDGSNVIDVTVDRNYLDQQMRWLGKLEFPDSAVGREGIANRDGIYSLLQAIWACFEDQEMGREKAEWPDDEQCSNCKRWFRRHELSPVPANQRYQMPGKTMRGKCPACDVDIYS